MSSTQVAHSLAFRVMRLCRPSFHVETPLRFDPCNLIGGEDLYNDPVAASHFPGLLSKHSPKPATPISPTAPDSSSTTPPTPSASPASSSSPKPSVPSIWDLSRGREREW
ncbi:hypothetical protein ACSBR1_017804 [Camellia fascicularis]